MENHTSALWAEVFSVDDVSGQALSLMRVYNWILVRWPALVVFNFLSVICMEFLVRFQGVLVFFFPKTWYCGKCTYIPTYIHDHCFSSLWKWKIIVWTWLFSFQKSRSIWFWSCCSTLNFFFSKDADLARKAFKPVERVLSSTSEEDEPVVVKFLKMNCRYFTDGKVGGTWFLGIVWDSLWISERWILGESNVLHFFKECKIYVGFIYNCCICWYCDNMLYNCVLLLVCC